MNDTREERPRERDQNGDGNGNGSSSIGAVVQLKSGRSGSKGIERGMERQRECI